MQKLIGHIYQCAACVPRSAKKECVRFQYLRIFKPKRRPMKYKENNLMKKACFAALLLLASCSSHPIPKTYEKGKADIVSTTGDSSISGIVEFTETPKGLEVYAQVEGLPPGKHGFHVHQYGDLGDSGKAAGSHFNPNNTKHGFIIEDGYTEAHAGDFGNITINEDGNGELKLLIPEMTLSIGPYSIAGRSLIIHEKEDDFGQPLGNAGPRIAGGIIVIVKNPN